jgi:hypothetical protein
VAGHHRSRPDEFVLGCAGEAWSAMFVTFGLVDEELPMTIDKRPGRHLTCSEHRTRGPAACPAELAVAAGRAVLAGAAQLINCVEEIRVLSATGYPQLLASAIARLGAKPGHKNLLVRVVLRDLDKTRTN